MVDKVRKSPTAQALADAYSALDTAVKKHLVHKNRVARVKSQLGKLVKPVQLEKTAPKKAVEKKAPAKSAKASAAKPAAAKKGSSKTTAKK